MLNVDSALFTSPGHNDICPALDPELDPVDRYQQSRQGVERRSPGPPYGIPIQSRYHEGRTCDRLGAYQTLDLRFQGMANLGEKSEISGSVLLSWHEKVRVNEISFISNRTESSTGIHSS
jgi:hypothetical protein